MVSIRYRKDRKKWLVDWRENGARSARNFTSEKTAKEFASLKEDQLERQRAGMLYLDMVTFSEYAEVFMHNHFKFLSPRYAESASRTIRKIFLPVFGPMDMHGILRSDIDKFIDARIGVGTSPKTIRNDIGLLNTMFDKAIKNNFALDNPAKDVAMPKNVPLRMRDAVPIEDVLKFCRQCSVNLKRAILILVNTGMRRGELIKSRGKDFDTVNGWLTIRSELKNTTKNYKSRRVPLPQAVIEIVRDVRPDQCPVNFDFNSIGRGFTYWKKKTGIKWTMHELRHTYISQQLKAGVDKRTLREWVGHQSDDIIDRYSHFIPDNNSARVNIGQSLLGDGGNVATIRQPKKICDEKNNENNVVAVGATGLEPVSQCKINNLENQHIKKQKQRFAR